MSEDEKAVSMISVVPKSRRGSRIKTRPGIVARARSVLLDDPLPPRAELEREAVNGLRQIIRDEECFASARVGAVRVMLEYLDKVGARAQDEPQTADDWETIERYAAEQKEKARVAG